MPVLVFQDLIVHYLARVCSGPDEHGDAGDGWTGRVQPRWKQRHERPGLPLHEYQEHPHGAMPRYEGMLIKAYVHVSLCTVH